MITVGKVECGSPLPSVLKVVVKEICVFFQYKDHLTRIVKYAIIFMLKQTSDRLSVLK